MTTLDQIAVQILAKNPLEVRSLVQDYLRRAAPLCLERAPASDDPQIRAVTAAIAELIETSAYGIYHLAGNGGASWYELTLKLYQLCNIGTRVRPVATSEFPRPAVRPRYSVLTSIQDPQILLPPWEEGLAEFSGKAS